jgi:hypothetical protein
MNNIETINETIEQKDKNNEITSEKINFKEARDYLEEETLKYDIQINNTLNDEPIFVYKKIVMKEFKPLTIAKFTINYSNQKDVLNYFRSISNNDNYDDKNTNKNNSNFMFIDDKYLFYQNKDLSIETNGFKYQPKITIRKLGDFTKNDLEHIVDMYKLGNPEWKCFKND